MDPVKNYGEPKFIPRFTGLPKEKDSLKPRDSYAEMGRHSRDRRIGESYEPGCLRGQSTVTVLITVASCSRDLRCIDLFVLHF